MGGVGLIAFAGLLSLAQISGTPLAGFAVGVVQAIFYVIGVVLLLLGILYLVVGFGYWGGKGWAWALGIILGIIAIIINIVQIGINPLTAASNIFGIIIALIILYYLTRPHVKAFFGKGPPMGPMMGSGTMTASTTGSTMGSGGTSSTMLRCPNCGSSYVPGTTKCPACGANL